MTGLDWQVVPVLQPYYIATVLSAGFLLCRSIAIAAGAAFGIFDPLLGVL